MSDWEVVNGITCVVCPDCGFTFDATHDTEGQCPNCLVGSVARAALRSDSLDHEDRNGWRPGDIPPTLRSDSSEWAQHLQDTYDEGKAAARRELEQTPSYIHGFNAGFDEAVKQLSEECIVCGEPYVSHCEMDEPGVDHPSSCRKKHHEFRGSGDNDG